MKREKINIGWQRCPIYTDYGIIRCFKCCKYGHTSKDCKKNTVCPKCSLNRDLKECNSNTNKCANCVTSNNKYSLNLNVDNMVWDVNLCETYKRIENYQKNKFFK